MANIYLRVGILSWTQTTKHQRKLNVPLYRDKGVSEETTTELTNLGGFFLHRNLGSAMASSTCPSPISELEDGFLLQFKNHNTNTVRLVTHMAWEE